MFSHQASTTFYLLFISFDLNGKTVRSVPEVPLFCKSSWLDNTCKQTRKVLLDSKKRFRSNSSGNNRYFCLTKMYFYCKIKRTAK